jgi:ribosome-associated toxin RatA of RatAB toxin-antitoxin module
LSLRHTLPLFCLLLLLGAPSGRTDAEPTLSADTGWQHVEDKAGVTLFSRTRVGTSVKEFKGTGLIPSPPAAVEKVLADVARYPSFMPYVTESRELSQDGAQSVTYQRLTVPWVANRDYTVRVEHGISKDAAGGTTYRDTWETANEAGPAERHGIVRVKVNEGSWLLAPTGPTGDSTQATYQIFTDSGGVVPAFLANRASQMIIPRLFEAIRKQARDPKYLR